MFAKIPLREKYINDGPHQTVFTTEVDYQYQERRIIERWTLQRINRLCKILSISPYELASSILVKHEDMEKYLTGATKIPGPVALLLTNVELFYVGVLTDKGMVKSLYPNLISKEARDQEEDGDD